VIREGEHHGVAHARNVGVWNARGTWVAFLDDDDRWAPTKLGEQLAAATAAGAPWVYSAAATIDHEDRMLFVRPPVLPETTNWLAGPNPVPGGCSNVIARAELVRSVDGFDENLALLADWDLWIRLAAVAKPAISEHVLVAYRHHPDNMHVREAETVEGELEYLAQKHESAIRGAAGDLPVSVAMVWLAKAYRRGGHPIRAARLLLKRWRATHATRDLVHALASLFGERALQVVRRGWTRRSVERPEWLDDSLEPTAPGRSDAARDHTTLGTQPGPARP
jgi:glycosyltransferase involved in cell wall biosynthesis